MDKPLAYEGTLLDEEQFSEKFNNMWESVTNGMTKEMMDDIRLLVYQSYKEGYADAWQKAVFMMK